MTITSLGTLSWTEDMRIDIHSEHELVAYLSGLQHRFRGEPTVVELTRAGGGSLAIGLGGDMAVLSLNPTPDPPYFASSGDADAAGSMWFRYYGSPSEFPRSQAIELDRAVEARRRFLRDGRPPKNVQWQQV